MKITTIKIEATASLDDSEKQVVKDILKYIKSKGFKIDNKYINTRIIEERPMKSIVIAGYLMDLLVSNFCDGWDYGSCKINDKMFDELNIDECEYTVKEYLNYKEELSIYNGMKFSYYSADVPRHDGDSCEFDFEIIDENNRVYKSLFSYYTCLMNGIEFDSRTLYEFKYSYTRNSK
jgi:hypothetical protein